MAAVTSRALVEAIIAADGQYGSPGAPLIMQIIEVEDAAGLVWHLVTSDMLGGGEVEGRVIFDVSNRVKLKPKGSEKGSAAEQIRASLRAQGRPLQLYVESGAAALEEASTLSREILQNFEDRLCRIEENLGLE